MENISVILVAALSGVAAYLLTALLPKIFQRSKPTHQQKLIKHCNDTVVQAHTYLPPDYPAHHVILSLGLIFSYGWTSKRRAHLLEALEEYAQQRWEGTIEDLLAGPMPDDSPIQYMNAINEYLRLIRFEYNLSYDRAEQLMRRGLTINQAVREIIGAPPIQ